LHFTLEGIGERGIPSLGMPHAVFNKFELSWLEGVTHLSFEHLMLHELVLDVQEGHQHHLLQRGFDVLQLLDTELSEMDVCLLVEVLLALQVLEGLLPLAGRYLDVPWSDGRIGYGSSSY